jgi:glutaredoxin
MGLLISDYPEVDAVKEQTDRHLVVVFASSWCAYCKQVARAFEEDTIDAHTVEVDEPLSAALASMTGSSSLPSVWVGDKYIGGYNDGKCLHMHIGLLTYHICMTPHKRRA